MSCEMRVVAKGKNSNWAYDIKNTSNIQIYVSS